MQIMMMGRPIRRKAPVILNPMIKPIVFLAELEVLELKSVTGLKFLLQTEKNHGITNAPLIKDVINKINEDEQNYFWE